MSNTETFYNELHAYVQQVANQIVDLSGGNSVVTGVVTQALGTYYTVKLTEGDSGSSVKAVTVNNNLNLSVNESVYLIKANGTLDSAYYILGRVESIQEAFLNLTLAERFQNETEIDATYRLNSLIQDEAVLETLRAKGAFQIGGTFTCSKANTEDYGVRVHLYRGNTLIKTYELNTHYFIGQPFKMMSMPQSRTVQLDETTLKSGFDAIKIETFGQDFTYNEVKLSVGFLLNVDGLISVDVTVINDKDYFSKHNSELANNVHLKAGVTYEGQDFSANSLQYYWMIKDDTITSTHEQYLEFVGEGWRCLNSYSNVSALNLDKPLQLWNCRTNEIILNDSEQCPQFINTLKCVIKYQQLVTESEEFTIYNYNKESFSAKVEASVSPALLILKTDSLILNCLVENANEEIDIKDYAYKYQWYDSKESIEGATQSSLNIITGEGFNEDTNAYGMLAEDIELTETFYCIVRTYQNNEDAALDNVLSVETSNSFQVVSKVAISAELKSPTYYKYYISNSPYCTFEKAPTSEDNLDWNGDWVIRDPDNPTAIWTVDNLLAGWDYENEIPIVGHQDSAAYNYINSITLRNGQYIYLTKKMLWYEEKLGKYKFLREENWSSPLITKGKTENGNDIVNAALEKLNTFNQLTEGGLQKGLLYNEENGDLYINADFINTGALTVADNAGKRIFYADVDQQKVEAGGFTVDNTSIRGMAVGISSNILQGDDPTPSPDAETGGVEELDGAIAFWAGATYEDRADAPFKVTHNGILYATGVKITELNQEVADRIAAMTETNKAIAAEKSAREQAIEDTKTLINNSVTDLQNQLDGEITTWFYEGAPSIENEPAINWVSSDEEMEKHIGDLYYDTETQYCYRWTRAQDEESYGWEQIADTGIVEAMAAASEAKGIADSKRQIFHRTKFDALTDVPNNYDINDMIVVGQLASSDTTASTQFYICTAVPGEGEGRSLSHWTLATDIATKAELSSQVSGLAETMEQNVNSLQSQVDKKIDTWFKTVAPHPSSIYDYTTPNAPASDWDDAEKEYHLDDLYYNSSTGYCYRWIKNSSSKYYWSRIKDQDITVAANAASKAQTTADGKITTHYGVTAPASGEFAEGDLWIPGESDGNANKTKVAVTNKNGDLEWVPLDDAATSKEVADVDSKLTTKIEETATTLTTNYTNLVNSLETELTKSLYFEATKLKDESNQEVPAIIMKAKNADNAGMMYFDTDQLVIKSDHLMLNHNGSQYKDGYFTIDTDNFKIDGSGNVTVTGTINATSLNIGAGTTQQSFDSIQQEINKNIKTATDTATSASQTANSASSKAKEAATVAADAKTTASTAKTTADGAKTTANSAVSTANSANTTAGEAKTTATQAKSTADTAKSTADTAKSTADTAKSTATKVAQDVETLTSATLPATYFGVGTDWIYLKSKGIDGSPGKILFDTDALVINTPNLKFNHTGSAYSQGAFMINTDSFSVNQTEGTICGLQMGKKNILYTSQTSEEKVVSSMVTISGAWSQVGSIDMGGKYPATIYSTHKILSYSELGVPTNAIVKRVLLTGVNGPSSGKYPQAWPSYFDSDSVTITALNTYIGGTVSGTCKVYYVTISQKEEEKPVSYLNSTDNSFYIRTSTDDSKYSESFIQDLNLVSVQSDQLIANTANIGTLSFNGTCITCQGMDIDFGYEIGDNNTRLEVNISHIGNLIVLTAQSAMGEFAGYPIQFLVRYKLDGNDDYFYTALELPALGTYVSKMIDSVFSITEVAFQSFDNPNNYMTEALIDIRDDYNGYDRGIGIGGGMLVPKGSYNSIYDKRIGGGLGSYKYVWGWVCTNSLSLRNVEMPTIEYGIFVVGDGEDKDKNWHSRTIELSGVYANTNPPIILATIEPDNNAATANLYVRASASVSDHKATATFNYRRNNDGTATVKWIAVSKVIAYS